MLASRCCRGVGLIATLFSFTPALADWPVFRGNACQTGVSNEPLPKTLVVKWKFTAKDVIEGSPVVAAQTVYFGSADGKVHALDLISGKEKWAFQGRSIKVSPAVRGDCVYVGDSDGILHCIDAATGTGRWKFATEGGLSPANFAGDNILVGSDDQHLYCIAPDGKLIWKCKTKDKLRGAPAVSGTYAVIGGCDQLLHVINLATGARERGIPLGGHVGASVAIDGSFACVGNMANKFQAIDWRKGGILWQFEAKRGGQPFFASPALTDDLVIGGSRDKRVRAWRRQGGKEAWSFLTNGRVDASPVVVGDRVFVGALDGNLYMLDLARGTELGRFELGGAISGSVAVSDQRLVVATLPGEVICLGAR